MNTKSPIRQIKNVAKVSLYIYGSGGGGGGGGGLYYLHVCNYRHYTMHYTYCALHIRAVCYKNYDLTLFVPYITIGNKECRGTLFAPYIYRPYALMLPILNTVYYPIYIGDKQCTPTLFVPYIIEV